MHSISILHQYQYTNTLSIPMIGKNRQLVTDGVGATTSEITSDFGAMIQRVAMEAGSDGSDGSKGGGEGKCDGDGEKGQGEEGESEK